MNMNCSCGFEGDDIPVFSSEWHCEHRDHHLAVYPHLIRNDPRTVRNLCEAARWQEGKEGDVTNKSGFASARDGNQESATRQDLSEIHQAVKAALPAAYQIYNRQHIDVATADIGDMPPKKLLEILVSIAYHTRPARNRES